MHENRSLAILSSYTLFPCFSLFFPFCLLMPLFREAELAESAFIPTGIDPTTSADNISQLADDDRNDRMERSAYKRTRQTSYIRYSSLVCSYAISMALAWRYVERFARLFFTFTLSLLVRRFRANLLFIIREYYSASGHVAPRIAHSSRRSSLEHSSERQFE